MSCTRGCCPTSREHYLSVGISASAMPTRSSPRVAETVAREKRWTKDFAAVKALKREGIVPKSSDGAAELVARAKTRYEIERGKTYTKSQLVKHEHILGRDLK